MSCAGQAQSPSPKRVAKWKGNTIRHIIAGHSLLSYLKSLHVLFVLLLMADGVVSVCVCTCVREPAATPHQCVGYVTRDGRWEPTHSEMKT